MAQPSAASRGWSSTSGQALLTAPPPGLWMKPEPMAVAIRLTLGSTRASPLVPSLLRTSNAAWSTPVHMPPEGACEGA